MLAFGFLGMQLQEEGLRFDPHIPASWGALRMLLEWRGRRLRVSAQPGGAEIAVEAGEPVALAFGDGPWQMVGEGQVLETI